MTTTIFFFLLVIIILVLLFFMGKLFFLWRNNQNQMDEIHEEKLRLTEKLLQLKNENALLLQKNSYLEKNWDKLNEQFKTISNETVSNQSYSFVKVIEEHISKLKVASKEENINNQSSLQNIITPMEDTIKNFEKIISSFDSKTSNENREIFSKLSEIIRTNYNLQQEVNKAIHTLRSPNVKGIWGEMQLKRLVQISGMEEHCDFEWQSTIAKGLKPDMVVNLPNGKKVIVDSKVSLSAYLNCMDTNDPDRKKYYLQEHAKQIKQHINILYSKKYWESMENSANFVILFLPGECFLSSALEVNASMIEYASKYNIILATPTTMIGLLKTISYGWENIHISKDIEKIKTIIQNLYSYLSNLNNEMGSMGKAIDNITNIYRNVSSILNDNIAYVLDDIKNKYSMTIKNIPAGKEKIKVTKNTNSDEDLEPIFINDNFEEKAKLVVESKISVVPENKIANINVEDFQIIQEQDFIEKKDNKDLSIIKNKEDSMNKKNFNNINKILIGNMDFVEEKWNKNYKSIV